ncbi:hypothetical protein, variant [Aphanomyces invadans]|uniref:Uncharacterized protein n=1 Tax=Aphanomyces invadans TaxID=157072 RepID=A0A024UHI2_9STRA|nr:hypothetical protein, variant [Aphanomyces invadans]ETW05660.1 hypothetical protein, variant [Aphanomyces invadans]|eukprot:XP_008865437.1 hypothetical protein, variant [Aphanomyces invadans]
MATAAVELERRRDRKAILEKTKQDVWTIWYATENGKVDRVRSLLEKKPSILNVQETRMKWTPLHFAARFAQEAVMRVLLEQRANPDIVDKDGNTALHLCAGWGSRHCCVLLLEGGADSQCLNDEGLTALEMACKMNHADIAQVLRSWVPVEPTMAQRQEKKRRIEAYICPDDAAIKREPELVYLELRALQSKETTLGPTHPGIIGTLIKLANLFKSLDRPADTIQSLRRALSINIFNFGELHVDTAILRSNLAAALFTSRHVDPGYVEEGVVLLQTALHVLSDSPETKYSMERTTCLENLCICLQYSSQHALAHGHMTELLKVFGATYGTDHEKVLGLHLALATKYIAERRFDEGESVFRQCADVAMKKHGRVHRTVSHCLDCLGRAYFVRGHFQQAEKTFLESLQILLVLYDASHVDIIRGHNNLAMVTIAMQSPDVVVERLNCAAL